MASQKKCMDEFEFRILTDADFQEVWYDLMANHFVTREPMSCHLQLNPDEGYKFVGEYTKVTCSHGVSLGAFDKKTGKVIAVRLSTLGRLFEDHVVEVPDDYPLKTRQALQAMSVILGGDLAKALGTNNYMEFVLLCCHSDYSGRGIASELYSRCLEIAKEKGVKKVFTMATSYYTQCITRKLGFRSDFSIAYKDYVDSITGTKIFEGMKEPHKIMSREVKDIE